MAIWGVDSGTIDEKRLSPLGLICYGGSSSEKGTTWRVQSKSKNDNFKMELNEKDFKNVGKIYKKFKLDLRKKKLMKINESKSR